MTGWQLTTLKDAGVVLIDCDHRTPPASETGYPYVAIPQLKKGRIDLSGVRRISPDHFEEWTRKAKPQHHDVVLSRRCNPGETAYVPAGLDFALGQNLVLLRAKGQKILPSYLRWITQGPLWWEQISKFINVGAVFNSLKCADVPKFEVPVPPLPDQRAIAAILGALDDKIELNRRMNTTLEAMARALFKSWFVDFDPVRAKMEGRPPFGMDAATAGLFPAALEESAAGEIPKGWHASDINKFALLNSESWSSREHPSTIQYVDLANTKWGTIESLQSFLWEEAPSRAQRVIRTGDTIVGTVRPGNGSYAYVYKDGMTASTGFAALRPREAIFKEFIYLAVTHRENIDRLAHIADGGAYPAVRPEVVAATPAIWPGEDILKAFSQILSPCFDRMTANKKECDTLSSLRDILLPKLISGELRVRDAEKFLKDAA